MNNFKCLLNVCILLTIFCSCSAQRSRPSDKDIIESIVQNGAIKKYLHFEIKERKNICIIKNDIFLLEEAFKTNDIFVSSDYKDDVVTLNYIEFKELNFLEHEIFFKFYYKIENLEVSGVLINKNKKWKIKEATFLEL